MTPQKKAALCAFGVGVLTLIGAMSPLCALVPAPWNAVCLGASKVSGEAAKHIDLGAADAGR